MSAFDININDDIKGDVGISYIEIMSPRPTEGEESLEGLMEGFSVRGLFRSLKIALSCIYGIAWAFSLSPDELEKARQELKAEMKKYWSQ